MLSPQALRLSRCLPPPSFTPVREVVRAEFVKPPSFDMNPRRGHTGARAAGLRYERKAHDLLENRYGWRYLRSPWIRFYGEGKVRLCQPDGLLFDFARGRITILEIKLRHTPDTYYQVMDLYLPVVEVLFPRKLWDIRLCEVCGWYDVATKFPYPTQLRENPEDAEHGFIGIHILSAR